MPSGIPDLWPEDVAVTDVMTPAAILRYQAGQLRQKTKNLVEAEVVAETDEDTTQLHFELIAPALQRYRYRLFSVFHGNHLVYPATISGPNESPFADAEASSQEEFLSIVGNLLQSKFVKSVIQSLVARSNDEGTDSRSQSGRPPAKSANQ